MVAFIWRIVVVGIAYLIAMGAGGALAPLLGIAAPPLPAGADPERLSRWFMLTSLLNALAVALLARGIGGARWRRWLILAAVVFAAQGINTLLEASIFSSGAVATEGGGQLFYLFTYLWPALASSGAAVWLWPAATGDAAFHWRGFRSVAVRFAGGVAAFMAIYLGVGALISPLVIDAYQQGVGELALPPFGQIVLMQLVRGAMFTSAAIGLVLAWRGQRTGFVIAFGVALWILLGPAFLLPAEWLPMSLRLIHGTELLVDSLLYAFALRLLFGARRLELQPSSGSPGGNLEIAGQAGRNSRF